MTTGDIEMLIINSRNRSEGTPSNFTFVFKNNISNVKNIVPISSQITHSQYTVNMYNNKIYFRHTNNAYYSVVLNIGFYTTDELIIEIMEQMNAAVGVADIYTGGVVDIAKCHYWIYQNNTTMKVSIKGGDLLIGTFEIFFDEKTAFNGGLTYYSIGYTIGMSGTHVGITSVEADYLPQLTTYHYDIRVEGLIKNKTYSSVGAYTSIMVLDQLQTDGSLNYHQSTIPLKFLPKSSSIKEIKVIVYNDLNKEAKLLSDWSMKIAVIRSQL